MASILTQAQFDLLGIINGGWLPLTTNPPLGNGTVNNDDILITNLIAGLIVSGMAGNDRITIANSPLGLLNTSNGGAGSDQIFGNNGVNVINGGADNDYIVGGQGIDTLDGGMGTDTLSYETTLANRGTTTGVTVTLNASGGGVVSGGDAGADLISNFENVVGSNADDTITGNASANVLLGLNGNDTLNGGAGNDYVDGGDGNDTLNGGDHNDTLYGGDGDDTLIGGSRTDTLNGGDGNDRLYGGILGDDGLHNFDYEVNTLNGDAGDDYLDGGYENCIYDGGEGDDTVMGAYGGSTFFGGSGSDTMDYRLAPASVGAAMADGDQQYIVNRGGLLSDSLYSVENLIGADSASNTLLGNSSANYLSGGSMSDSLSGNGGNDIIDGGLGRDKLTGGVGNDRFVFNAVADSTAGTFRDEITDFAQGVDKIDLSAIDANGAAAGDPLFAFIGTAAFTAPGQIRWNAGSGTVEINVDGTSGAEMGIRLLNEVQPQQGDFVL